MFNAMPGMEVPFSQTPVLTDDNLMQDFVRVTPDDKLPEKLKTRCWFWYDENALYVKFEAEIDSTFKRGVFYPKDNGQDGDYVRLQLITIPEAYYAYYYIGTPTGNLNDAVRTIDNVDYQWNSSYSYQTEICGDSLWITDMTIPFRELRFNAKPPYWWKVILSRSHKENDEFYSMPYANTKDGKDYFTKAADITLTHPIKRSSDLKFKPYFVKSYDLVNRTSTFDPENLGIDISFNPSTKTKLKLTLNPDFTDIPPDNAQNDYNNRYPTYYEENRFFFTEDLDAFEVDYGTFYTRHILQPRLAMKLTGNNQTLNYGFLGALDKKISSDGEILNQDDYYQMASVIKTLPRFKAKLSAVSRLNRDYCNHVGIEYWKWEFIKEFYFEQAGMLSYKHPRPDEETDNPDLKGREYA